MNATGNHRSSPRRRRQGGFVMVTGLLFLVVMTLLGLALFRGTGLMDRITTNTRDKQRAFEAAQGALEYGVWWLTANGGAATPCSGNNTTIHVCSEALPTAMTDVQTSTQLFGSAYRYTPPNMSLAASGAAAGGMAADNIDIKYYAAPGVYIEPLGTIGGKGNTLSSYYQVTAFGYAGDVNTMSIVRGTYMRTQKSTNLNGP